MTDMSVYTGYVDQLITVRQVSFDGSDIQNDKQEICIYTEVNCIIRIMDSI